MFEELDSQHQVEFIEDKSDEEVAAVLARMESDDAADLINELPEELASREHEVLQLLAQGLSNAEIGTQLYIGETTVKTHVTRVLQKLNVRDRAQAIVVAHRTGLVDED